MGPGLIPEGWRTARPGVAETAHGNRTTASFELEECDHVLINPWSLRARPCRFARMRSGAVQGWWRVRLSLVSPDLQSNLSSLEHSDARFTLDGRAHSPPGASIGSGSWILGWWRPVRQTWGQSIKPPFPFMIPDPGPVENPGFCPDRHTAVAPRTWSLHIAPTPHPSPLRNFSTPASNRLSPQVPDNMGRPLEDPTRDHQRALRKRPTSSPCGC